MFFTLSHESINSARMLENTFIDGDFDLPPANFSIMPLLVVYQSSCNCFCSANALETRELSEIGNNQLIVTHQ